MFHRFSRQLFYASALGGMLACAGCGAGEAPPAAPPASAAPAVVKTYICKACGSVTSKPTRLGRCPRQKDGGPCRWKEIPRTN